MDKPPAASALGRPAAIAGLPPTDYRDQGDTRSPILAAHDQCRGSRGRLASATFASALLLTLGIGLSACQPEYPGESLGTYEISGQLLSNDCGAGAVPAIDSFAFAVDLRVEGNSAYWRRPSRPVISGIAEGQHRYRFEARAHLPLPQAVPYEVDGTCVLEQYESIAVTLSFDAPDDTEPSADAAVDERPDAGSPDVELPSRIADGVAMNRLVGENEIRFTPVTGSICTAATAASGGPFQALPCGVRYRLEGNSESP